VKRSRAPVGASRCTGVQMENGEQGPRWGVDAQGVIPDVQTPLARVLAHENAYWTCIAAVEPRRGWVLFHNAALVGRIDPNHAGGFRAPEGTGAAIAREVVAFYEALGAPPAAFVDALATPRDLVPCLLGASFREWSSAASDLMLYVGPDAGRPASHDVAVVRTDRDAADWVAVIEEEADAETRRRLRRLYAAEIADPRVTAYLVRVDGHPAGRGELFSSEGLGRVEAVRTLATYRGRGLASAIVRQAARDSLARGNALTYIYAEPNGAAQRLYDRLGFRLVAANAIRVFIR
jgi:ribosomal protein S18 acetylase RimI-like enzyme